MCRVVIATSCKIFAIRRPGQAADLLSVGGNSGQLEDLSVRFRLVGLGIGTGPFDGIIVKIPDIIANQQVFACYVEATEEAGGPDTDGWLEGEARDRA